MTPRKHAIRAISAVMLVACLSLIPFVPGTVGQAAQAASPTTLTVKSPAGLALSPNGKTLYVASQSGDSIVVFDTASGALLGSVPFATTTVTGAGVKRQVLNPQFLILNAAGTRLYVGAMSHGTVNDYSGALLVIDTAALKVVDGFSTRQMYGIDLSPDGKLAYLATGDCEVTVVNLNAGSSADPTEVVVGPSCQITDVAASPDGRFVYAASVGSGQLLVLDARATKLSQVGSIPMDPGQFYVSVSRDGKKLVVSLKGGTVDVVSLAGTSGKVTGSIVGGDPKNQVDTFVNSDGTVAYRPQFSSNRVDVLDLGRHDVSSQVTTGAGPLAVVTDRQGRTAYIGNFTDGTVSVVRVPAATSSGASGSQAGATPAPQTTAPAVTTPRPASATPSSAALVSTPTSTNGVSPLVVALVALIAGLCGAGIVLVVLTRRRQKTTP